MASLNSSMLSAADYDPTTSVLEVTFSNGATYYYDEVPQAIYDALIGASSAGRYFLDNIKDQYRTRRG